MLMEMSVFGLGNFDFLGNLGFQGEEILILMEIVLRLIFQE